MCRWTYVHKWHGCLLRQFTAAQFCKKNSHISISLCLLVWQVITLEVTAGHKWSNTCCQALWPGSTRQSDKNTEQNILAFNCIHNGCLTQTGCFVCQFCSCRYRFLYILYRPWCCIWYLSSSNHITKPGTFDWQVYQKTESIDHVIMSAINHIFSRWYVIAAPRKLKNKAIA